MLGRFRGILTAAPVERGTAAGGAARFAVPDSPIKGANGGPFPPFR